MHFGTVVGYIIGSTVDIGKLGTYMPLSAHIDIYSFIYIKRRKRIVTFGTAAPWLVGIKPKVLPPIWSLTRSLKRLLRIGALQQSTVIGRTTSGNRQ